MTLGELRGPSQQQSRISGPIRRVTTPPHGGSTQRLDGDRSLPAIACPQARYAGVGPMSVAGLGRAKTRWRQP